MTKEEKRQYAKKHYKANKAAKKAYQEANKKHIAENKKKYFQKNKEDFYKRAKKYLKSIKEQGKIKKTKKRILSEKSKEKIKIRHRLYDRHKKLTDPLFKLKHRIRSRIRHGFEQIDLKKINKTVEILGCTFHEFKLYIESKWKPWMNWQNYGKYNGELDYGWDLDHIVPISNAKTENDVIKLSHYTNFQPLCSKTNRHIKSNK